VDEKSVATARSAVEQSIYAAAITFGDGQAASRAVVYMLFLEEAVFSLRAQAENDPEFAGHETHIQESLKGLLDQTKKSADYRREQRHWTLIANSADPVGDAIKTLADAITSDGQHHEYRDRSGRALMKLGVELLEKDAITPSEFVNIAAWLHDGAQVAMKALAEE
jgi:hypothetical protein